MLEVSAGSRWQLAVWFALGAAAVVLLVFGSSWFAKPTEVVKQTELPPSYTWLQDEQLRNKAVLLNEMESIFGRKLNWLAETRDSVQIGVESQSPAGDAQAST